MLEATETIRNDRASMALETILLFVPFSFFFSCFFLSFSLSLPFNLPPPCFFLFFFFPEREQRILLGRRTNEISFYEHSTTSRSWDRPVRGKRFEKRNAIVITECNFEFAGSYSFNRTVGAYVLIQRFSFPLSRIPISRVPFRLFQVVVLLFFIPVFSLLVFLIFIFLSYPYFFVLSFDELRFDRSIDLIPVFVNQKNADGRVSRN